VGGERRRQKSLRNGVHHANAVVWGPVYRTHLSFERLGGGELQRRLAHLLREPRVLRRGLERRARGPLARDSRLLSRRAQRRDLRGVLRVEGPCEATNVGVEFKGVRSGVERRRGVSGLKAARGDGRRDAPEDKVLNKDRRSPRQRGRMGTSVKKCERACSTRFARNAPWSSAARVRAFSRFVAAAAATRSRHVAIARATLRWRSIAIVRDICHARRF